MQGLSDSASPRIQIMTNDLYLSVNIMFPPVSYLESCVSKRIENSTESAYIPILTFLKKKAN